jgi:hypothetical protein
MRPIFVSILFLCAAAPMLASNSGVTVNGSCIAGTCPAAGIPIGTIDTVSFDYNLTLADGDKYLIYGSFTGNNSGGSQVNTYAFQVVYQGSASGGASLADTITVQRDAAFQSSATSEDFTTSLVGAFGGGIASTSSASSCFDATFGCLGPVSPPGSFSQSNTFLLTSSGGAFLDNKTFVNGFGAGSPVGSYIVWGQTGPLTPPASVPEPSTLGFFGVGVGLLVRKLLRTSPKVR